MAISSRTLLLSLALATAGAGLGCEASAPLSVAPPNVQPPHEPPGLTRIFEHNFSCLPGLGCDLAGASTVATGGIPTLMLDNTAPKSRPSVLQITWPINMPDGEGPLSWDGWDTNDPNTSTRLKEMYLTFWAKIPTPDFENQSVGTKLFYIEYGNTYQSNEGFLMLDNDYGLGQIIEPSWRLRIYLSEADDRTGQGDTGLGHDQNVDATRYFTCGVWHQVEMYFKVNTVDQHDGIFRMWIDGHLITEILTQKYLDSRFSFTQGFFMFHMDPVWGGFVGNVKTRSDFIWYDHIYISGLKQ
jgi:hypothetical protein